MRQIEFRPGTHPSTMERIAAIAWATNRRGRVGWRGKNALGQLRDYLAGHNYHIGMPELNQAIAVLVKEGYAEKRTGDHEKRTAYFNFLPDVQLTGFSLPEDPTPARGQVREPVQSQNGSHVEKEVAVATLPPIPALPEPPVYRFDELELLLKAWSKKDPESYATWIDAAIESLQVNT